MPATHHLHRLPLHSSFIEVFYLFLSVCGCLPECIHVHPVDAVPEDAGRVLGTGVIAGCELPLWVPETELWFCNSSKNSYP